MLPSVYILSVVGTGRGCVILDVIMHHGPQDGRYSGHNAMSGCSNLPTSIRTPRLLGQPGLLSFWFSLGFYYCTFRFVFGRKNMENESIYYIRNETYPIYLSTICRALQSNGRRSTIETFKMFIFHCSFCFLQFSVIFIVQILLEPHTVTIWWQWQMEQVCQASLRFRSSRKIKASLLPLPAFQSHMWNYTLSCVLDW